MYQRVGTLSYHRPDALASLAQAYSAQGSHVSTICIRLHDYSVFHRAFEVRAKPAKWAIIPWCKPLPSSSVPVISGEVSTRKKKKKWRPYYESLNTDASHKKHLILSKRATQRQISVVLTDNTVAAPPLSEWEEAYKRAILTKPSTAASVRALKKKKEKKVRPTSNLLNSLAQT